MLEFKGKVEVAGLEKYPVRKKIVIEIEIYNLA